ncbi:HAMP domain-containing protein, partial [Colwellia ponticola]|uniref:HAMP domain-containing protein n=1 Tax=Colwellia ponticola TaxID=2304625 RepID=UPI001486D544
NFALRVDGRTGADEIGMLNRAFNRMTQQLDRQTTALDERRAFMEAVLDSVTAGVISLNESREVLLINGSGQDLLLQGGESNNPLGMSMVSVSPQIDAMLEAGLTSGVVTHSKGSELLTLAVKIAPENDGHVITFEDITRQLL